MSIKVYQVLDLKCDIDKYVKGSHDFSRSSKMAFYIRIIKNDCKHEFNYSYIKAIKYLGLSAEPRHFNMIYSILFIKIYIGRDKYSHLYSLVD